MPFVVGFVVAFVVVRLLAGVARLTVGVAVAHPGPTLALVGMLALWSRLA